MNAEIECWLRQIADQPDDWMIRKVFADFLQDRDDHRADAVRASRDAEECLLEFPNQEGVIACPHSEYACVLDQADGFFFAMKTLRPVLRVTGFKTFRLDHLSLAPAVKTDLRVAVATKAEGGYLPLLVLRQYRESWVNWNVSSNRYIADSMYLSLSADPPTQVRWTLSAAFGG